MKSLTQQLDKRSFLKVSSMSDGGVKDDRQIISYVMDRLLKDNNYHYFYL